jgi:hypothetical protein
MRSRFSLYLIVRHIIIISFPIRTFGIRLDSIKGRAVFVEPQYILSELRYASLVLVHPFGTERVINSYRLVGWPPARGLPPPPVGGPPPPPPPAGFSVPVVGIPTTAPGGIVLPRPPIPDMVVAAAWFCWAICRAKGSL